MKKPFLLLSLLLTFGLHADCAAWGTVGHRAIAEAAQRHLTPKAKAAIENVELDPHARELFLSMADFFVERLN